LAEHLPPGGEVIGVDVASDALAEAKRRAQSHPGPVTIRISPGDVFALPFDHEEFDFAWCAQSLISLSEPEETPARSSIPRALGELHRILRPGGGIGLLEEDAMHHLLLPWPAELELAIQYAQRLGFARMYGHPRQLDMGRQLRKLLAISGFRPVQRITLSADRQGIPKPELRMFLHRHFQELRRRVEQDLSTEDLRQFDRLTDPASESSFFHDPDFEMTWLEFVSLGIRA
jgi:SAM-dependent methyltransferase